MSIGNATIRETSQLPAAYRSRRGPNWAGSARSDALRPGGRSAVSCRGRRSLLDLGRAIRRTRVNIALRITNDSDAAADCAQEAFIRAYRALHQYDPSLPLGPWLYRITTNASLNYVQRWHAHETPVEEFPDSAEPDSAGPESSALRREELDEVVAALAELPAHYRAALTLRHFQQLSYQEVADALGIPLGTVKTHLHRARAALKVRLAARAKERSA